jgi:8-oxo-dGTP pyrophosphatase MutT (NUDIX family)
VKPIRSAAKALIIRDGQLLATRNVDGDGEFYLLPGGGQEFGEPLDETMRRECREEIGCEVEVHDLVLVRDYIASNHEFAQNGDAHQVEFYFQCTLHPDTEPCNGPGADTWQTGIAWLPLEQLSDYPLYPKVFQTLLRECLPSSRIYLGDVN